MSSDNQQHLSVPNPVAEATVRASLTETGQARYAELQELLERRGEWAESDGSPGTTCPESGLVELPGSTIEVSAESRRCSAAPLGPAGGRLDPACVSDSQLGVLSRQAQWALDEAGHGAAA
ncbi:MAG: hypothetical protein ACRDTE_17770 [Pseudonocardiaceae bacterium]